MLTAKQTLSCSAGLAHGEQLLASASFRQPSLALPALRPDPDLGLPCSTSSWRGSVECTLVGSCSLGTTGRALPPAGAASAAAALAGAQDPS